MKKNEGNTTNNDDVNILFLDVVFLSPPIVVVTIISFTNTANDHVRTKVVKWAN